jgi:hypothetical protein
MNYLITTLVTFTGFLSLIWVLRIYRRHKAPAPVYFKLGILFLGILFIYQLVLTIRYFIS